MFTAIEFKLIREKCPEKLDALLDNLKIETPNWKGGDEFRIYEKLDDEIVNRVCQLLKCNAVIVGYEKLIVLGGLKFDYSKTDNEILKEVLHFEKQIKNRLQEKIIESEKISALSPEVEPVEFDYSKVEFKFLIKKPTSLGLPKKKEDSSLPKDLETQIKNLICDYLREKENFNVVEAIKISVKTTNDTYPTKKSPQRKEITMQPETPPFSQDELAEVMKSLKLVDDIVKTI